MRGTVTQAKWVTSISQTSHTFIMARAFSSTRDEWMHGHTSRSCNRSHTSQLTPKHPRTTMGKGQGDRRALALGYTGERESDKERERGRGQTLLWPRVRGGERCAAGRQSISSRALLLLLLLLVGESAPRRPALLPAAPPLCDAGHLTAHLALDLGPGATCRGAVADLPLPARA